MSAPHGIVALVTACFRGVLQASWQGSLAIVLVLLVRRGLGTRVPARWHYLLWFLVLARLLVPTIVLPPSPVSLENVPAIAHPFERPPSILKRAAPTILSEPASLMPSVSAPSFVTKLPSRPDMAPPSPSKAWSLWIWATWVWLGGVLVFSVWLAACVVGLRGRLRCEAFPAEESILAVWQACCQRWLRRPPPRLLVADWIDSPALVGWRQPVLLVPRRSLDSFSAQDWEHVFAHEIAHLRWRDHWSQLLLLTAWCVHWFNPVVWLGLRRLRADRELAADEWVLRHLQDGRALAYGETLFKTLANRPARLAIQPGMVGISEDGAQMKQRLRRITAFLPHRRLQGSLAGCAALLVLGTVVLGQSTPPAAHPPGNAAAPSPATSAAPVVSSPDAAVQQLADSLLAAARAGDRRKVTELLHPTGPHALYLGGSNAAQILDDLLRHREINAFTVLIDASQRSNFAKDWQVSDPLLAGLVKDGRTDFLDLLLAGGLDPVRLGEQAKSADQSTAGWITRRVAEETRRRADIEALESAAARGDLPAMSRLVDAGADVNGVGKDHNTPLIRAVFKNRLEAAQWLLDHGAQVDKPRYPGWDYTPLCLVNSVPMAELLKKNGANVHAKLYGRDVSILTYVVQFAKSDVVEWFLRQGLDPKMKEGDGKSNLLFGLEDGRTATLLLDAGLNPNQVDKDGRTPLSTARNGEVAQALIDHGAKVTGLAEPLLPNLVQFGTAGVLEAVLKAGADQDDATLQAALAGVDRMDIRDYPEKDAMRRVLIKHGAKPSPIQPTPRPSISCRGMVSVADGTFADFSTVEVHYSESYGPDGGGGRSWSFNHADADGSVNLNIEQGVTSASYAAVKEGYATVYAGPFTPPTKEKIDGLRFVLTKGFSAAIVTVDEAGQPIAGARLQSYYPGPPMTELAQTTTDASGRSVIEHIGEAPVNVRVRADGFQADELTGVHLDPAKPCSWTLKKAQPQLGIVTAAATGKPIAGAIVKLAGVLGPHPENHFDPKQAPVWTTADAQGRFVLSSLRPDSRYYLYVDAPGYSGAYLRGVQLAQDELHVTLGPELFIQGKIIHAPPSVVYQGKLHLSYQQTFHLGENTAGAAGGNLDLHPINGEADFTVGPFYKVYGEPVDPKHSQPRERNRIELYVGAQGDASFDVDELPISNFVFDLAKKSSGQRAEMPVASPAAQPADNKPDKPAPVDHPTVASPTPVRSTGQISPPDAPAAASLSGLVTDAATGQPIVGAKVRLTGKMELISAMHYGPRLDANDSTAADARGRFMLSGLRPGTIYWLFVEAPGYGVASVAVDKLPSGGLQVKLGPERFIRGRIVHAPASMIHDGKLSLSFAQGLEERPGERAWTTLTLEPKNGEADFVAGPFYLPQGAYPYCRAPVSLRVDDKDQAYFRGEDLPGAGYTLDLAPDLGQIEGEYKTAPESPWTLDLRRDGTAYYSEPHGRYTARYARSGKLVTFTFPDGLQEHLQLEGSQLLGMPENKVLPTFERFTPGGGQLEGEYRTSATAVWTLDLRKDGMAYYYSDGNRYTARYALADDMVTFTFGNGKQEHLQREGSQLLGMPENKVLPGFERLKKQ